MFSNTSVLAFIGGCVVALLILTSCQQGNSILKTIVDTDIVPEVIQETIKIVETVEVAQPTVEQQRIAQSLTKQEQPTAIPNIVEPTASSRTEESAPRILLIDRMADWDSLTYTRLIEIAAAKGLGVDFSTSLANYQHYDGIIVFGGGGGNNETNDGGAMSGRLFVLVRFGNHGGRSVFFAIPRMDKLSLFL